MKPSVRILYLDTTTTGRGIVQETLEKHGGQFQLVAIETPDQFKAQLQQHEFDLLLIGLVRENSAATELLDWLKARGHAPPVVLMADPELEEDALNAVKDGIADYVIKTSARIQRLPFSIRLALECSRSPGERQSADSELRRLTEDLERRLADRTAQLAAANRELEAFSYSVSHDLRAPLRAIEGFARILIEDHAEHLQPDARRCIDIIVASTEQMNRLIEDLLAFSRLTRADLSQRDVDMTALAQSVLSELRRNAPDHAATVTVSSLLPAKGDPALLRQVWSNLLSNAFKFTRLQPAPMIEIGSRSEADDHVYFVKDNGVGFDMQYAHKLFNVFQRLHRSDQFEGTGVGLATVKRIILRHQGRVWAKGDANAGATFYFSLPKDPKRL